MITSVSLMDDQIVDMAFITQPNGLTDKRFYRLTRDGVLPAPIKLSRSFRWPKSKVEVWLQARIVQPCLQFLTVIRSPAADVIPGLSATFCCLSYPPREI